MRQCVDVAGAQARLGRIEGQIRAISQMLDRDVPCEDILIQVSAARSALHRVGLLILEGHMQHCVREGIEHGDADQTIDRFTKAVELFSRMG